MNNEEEILQVECILLTAREFPEIAPTITENYNNIGAGVDKGRAATMVGREISKGLKPGEPDWTIYYKKRAFCIEFKTEKGTLSKNQKAYIPHLLKQDIPVFLCRNKEEFRYILSIIETIKDEGIKELIEANVKFLIKL